MDKEKIEALCNGNHKAFESISISYFRRVKIFICGIVKSEADAAEAFGYYYDEVLDKVMKEEVKIMLPNISYKIHF